MKKNLLGLLLSGLLAGAVIPGAAQAQAQRALSFTSAESDKVTVPMVLPATGPFTLEAWVNYTNAQFANDYNTILEFGNDDPWFGVNSTGELALYSVAHGGSVPRNTWVHVAYTWDGTTSRVFINGNQVGTSTTAPDRLGNSFGIGYSSGDTGWQGYIDEVMVWSTARSVAELQADRQLAFGSVTAMPASTAGLLAYFKFNEGSGQTVGNMATGGVAAGVLGSHSGSEIIDPSWTANVVTATAARKAPAALALQPAVPNPFSESTKLSFTLPSAGPASVRVLDVTGRQVAVLMQGQQAAGRHTAVLRSEALKAGIYTVELTTEAGVSQQKVLLTR
jgi:hypothetical protein